MKKRCKAPLDFLVMSTILVVASSIASAASKPKLAPQKGFPAYALPNTQVRTIRSSQNGVRYRLFVSLPKGYRTSAERYPVVYTLDADYAFAIARNTIEHFSDRKDLPRMIVIGIAYEGGIRDLRAYRLNRVRDYSPTHTLLGGYGPSINRVSGGGPKFRRFIRTELFPLIDSTYRTKAGDRTLVGHSLGGLFGTYVLFSKPGMFRRYILVSPSLWWDQGIGKRLEERFAQSGKLPEASVFFSVGAKEENFYSKMVTSMQALVASLKRRSYPGLRVTGQVFPGETHNSVFPAALSRGLRVVFER